MSTTIDNVTYTYSGSTASVTGFTGGAIGVVIPSSITVSGSTYTVTSIGDFAFEYKGLTSVSIPASVTSIGQSAFFGTPLTSIFIPASVTIIGDSAFYDCSSLASVTFEQGSQLLSIGNQAFQNTALTSVVIPASVTIIGYQAFFQNTALTSISIPASVTSIGNEAFFLCNSLANVTFGAGSQLLSIGNYAFLSTLLTSITIPANVTSIGDSAFAACNYLASVTFLSPTTIPYLSNFFGINADFQSIQQGTAYYLQGVEDTSKLYLYFLSVTELPIPPIYTLNDVVYTLNYENNTASVTGYTGVVPSGVVIPESFVYSGLTFTVTSIGNNAFQNTGLLSISIPASVESIGDSAFQNTPPTIVVNFLSPTTLPTLTNPFGISPETQGTATYLYTVTSGVAELYLYFTNVVLTCFLEGTKILTNKGYKKIEELKKGDLVKTLSSGYKKIDMIGYKNMWNPASDERIKDQLYVYKKNKMEEVFEDLVLTGCHSVLIDRFETSEKREKVRKLLGGIFITEKKARLPACLDERAEVYKKEGLHTIYHVALENEDYYNNYGIYANGLLVESCSKRYLKELSGMMLKE